MWLAPDKLPRAALVREGDVTAAGFVVLHFATLRIVRVANVEFARGVLENVHPEFL